MSDLPAPLVPPEVDLRDFPYLPIDIARLFGSEFHARSTDTVWRAGLTLWLKIYHQVPAASAPDDDVALARLAELGRDLKTWRRIKPEVLRGWVRCSDGRLYHPVVAEKVLEAWIEKLMQRKASAAGNAKRYKLPFNPAPFDAAVNDSLARLAALNPNSRALARRVPKGAAKADDGTPMDPPVGDEPAPSGMPEPSRPEAGTLPTGGRNAPTGIAREGKGREYTPRAPFGVSTPGGGDAAARHAPAGRLGSRPRRSRLRRRAGSRRGRGDRGGRAVP